MYYVITSFHSFRQSPFRPVVLRCYALCVRTYVMDLVYIRVTASDPYLLMIATSYAEPFGLLLIATALGLTHAPMPDAYTSPYYAYS